MILESPSFALLSGLAGIAAILVLLFVALPRLRNSRHREHGLIASSWGGPARRTDAVADAANRPGDNPSGDTVQAAALAELAPAAICVTDEQTGRFLFANARAHQLLDVPPGGLLERAMPSFYVDPARREDIVDEIRRTGGVEERVIDVTTDAGRQISLAVTVRRTRWHGRRALVWAAVDMSGIQETFRELNRQDALNSTILETLLDGLIVMTPSGEIRVFNAMAERIFGWRADEIVGESFRRLLADGVLDPGESTTEFLRDFVEVRQGRSVGTRREIEGRRQDGESFPLELTVAEIAADDGPTEHYFLGIARDVTERRRSIDALIAARTEAEVAQRTQRDFLAHMSHELRTPLNSILGFSELIQIGAVGPLPDKYREYAASIHLAGDHLLRLINDVLDLSKVEQGYLVLHEERVRPEDLLDAVQRLFKPKAQERRLLLDVQPPSEPFDILGDFVRLRQILFNLVSNALKFSPLGARVLVSISRLEATGEVRLAVEDSGPGMTDQEIEVALKPFGQVRSEITRTHEGTGLGLAISKSLAERHDGRLEIASTPDQGTTVSVRLPAVRALPRDTGTAA